MLTKLKHLASYLAAVVVAAGTAMTGGLFSAPPVVVQLTLAGAGALSILGVSPVVLNPTAARLLALVAGCMTAISAAHVQSIHGGAQPHPWLWSAFGVASVIVGLLGNIRPITADKTVTPQS